MSKRQATSPKYAVSIVDDSEDVDALRFTYDPRGPESLGSEAERPESVQPYVVSVQVQGCGDDARFHWIRAPEQKTTQDELETIARQRVSARHEWLERLGKLVATVKGWADELGWATKVVDKKMEDAEIGNYKAPGLLLQQEVVRLFLEPISRTAPGTEGLVDLYLMPSYDDIASLYFYDGHWNVHYMFEGTPTVGDIRQTKAEPLSKAMLQKVFDEMKANAE
jgi:hypothetical protein